MDLFASGDQGGGGQDDVLDHALLESLFFNEMATASVGFLEDSSVASVAAGVTSFMDDSLLSGEAAWNDTHAAGGQLEAASLPAASSTSTAPDADEQEKRKKMVSQFANLASKLGIQLPPQAVEDLAKGTGAAPLLVAAAANDDTEKRKAGSTPSNMANKRRKKPRLQEVEQRLAQLRAENETLKRHMDVINQQSQKFDQERVQMESKLSSLLHETSEAEMDAVVKNYTELYSDYGRRRHQELEFHLNQLQRLANPTNFTKMGLWTLSQQTKDPKRNPIAGILKQELDISPAQGRKITEQRQKIQEICANLRQCIHLLTSLQKLCHRKTQIFHQRLTKCREILKPSQVVQLLAWIREHSSILDAACPGWSTEQIQAASKRQEESNNGSD